MFHSGTQTLIDLWAALPDARRIPARADLQPMAFGALVPQLFMADKADGDARFRLAGGWIEAVHGQPLKGVSWLSLWRRESRPLVASSVVQAFREARPVVLAADAAGLEGVLEIAIAPLRGPTGAADRLIGLYQITTPIDRYAEVVGPLSARLAIGVGPIERPFLTLAALDGRRIA